MSLEGVQNHQQAPIWQRLATARPPPRRNGLQVRYSLGLNVHNVREFAQVDLKLTHHRVQIKALIGASPDTSAQLGAVRLSESGQVPGVRAS